MKKYIIDKTIEISTALFKEKYGEKSELCIVGYCNGKITVQNSAMTSTISDDAKEPWIVLRRQCAENILMKYGPISETGPAILQLVPTYSLLKGLGPKRFLEFLYGWHGVSSVGNIEIAKYTFLKR